MRTPRVVLITALLTLAVPATASAGYFPSAAVDASPDIQRLGDLDVSHDGTGAVTYVKRDGGVDHVYVSRLVNGTFQPPERVDGSLAGAGSQPVVAASDGGRVTVVFVSGGGIYATVHQAGGTTFTQPQQLAAAGSNPSVDMSINGVGYTSFTTPGTSAADIHVARLERRQTQYAALPGSADLNAASDAGVGAGRSRVSASADGSGIVVWGENGRIGARRLYSDHLSSIGIDLTADTLDGHAGGPADSPAVDVEDDSSFAWVTYREMFNDGRVHTVGRRLVGSAVDPAAAVDGLGYGGAAAASASVSINGRGEGLFASGSSVFGSFVSLIHEDKVFPAASISGPNAVAPQPVGAESENNDVYVAWIQGSPMAATVHAVYYDVNPADRGVPAPMGDTPLSSDALGRVDPDAGMDLSMDRVGDMAVAFVQTDGTTRRLVVAGFDRPPAAFTTTSVPQWRKAARPTFSWSSTRDLWGTTYDVQVDGKSAGTTADTSIKLPVRVADGEHQFQVLATDAHGQQVTSLSRTFRVDATPPVVSFKVSGTRRPGGGVKITARAADGSFDAPSGSGVARVTIAFGDKTVVARRSATHAYRRSGTFTVKVTATDKAGNATTATRAVHIKG